MPGQDVIQDPPRHLQRQGSQEPQTAQVFHPLWKHRVLFHQRDDARQTRQPRIKVAGLVQQRGKGHINQAGHPRVALRRAKVQHRFQVSEVFYLRHAIEVGRHHLFRLHIIWENGIAVRPDVALVWRGVTPNICEDWSEEEDMIMRRCYPEDSQIELMKALPHRAWYRICDRAQVLNLRRNLPHQGRARVNVYHRTMRFDDLEAVVQLGQGLKEKERLCQIANELAEGTMRGGLSAYWWLPLEGIGYSGIGNDSAYEAGDVDLFNLSAFPCVDPRHSDAKDFTVDLPTLEAITMALATLFGLTLPKQRTKKRRMGG
jgi:hypothetical protein